MPALKTRFLSHGTLGSKDLEKTRQFYEEFLGLEVVRTSPVSLMIRLGGQHVYAVVLTKNKEKMPRCYHNGLDVGKIGAAAQIFRRRPGLFERDRRPSIRCLVIGEDIHARALSSVWTAVCCTSASDMASTMPL